MPRFYTKTGDKGTSAIFGGYRHKKSSPLFRALGALDEVNGLIGIARTITKKPQLARVLLELQNDLFRVGADVATPMRQKTLATRIGEHDVQKLEVRIDALAKDIPPLTQFVIPGESASGAYLHFARAVARRAERDVIHAQKLLANPTLIPWLNRLSSLLFVLALQEDFSTKNKFKHPSYRA